MKTTRNDMKSFWRGWRECATQLLFEEDRAYNHLFYLFCLPIYPLIWLAIMLWLPQGEPNDQNREDP